MPDIRTTPTLDDFNRANEAPIQLPWARADNSWQLNNLQSFRFTGNVGDSVSYWTPLTLNGDMEVWGRTGPGVDLTEAWRIGLLTDVGGTSAVDGYLLLVVASGGVANWLLRRYLNFGNTLIGSVLNSYLPADDVYILMRTVGTHVEVWRSTNPGDPSAWTQMLDVVDNTYRTNLRLSLGISTDDAANPTWERFGGGASEEFIPQFYRRPWIYRQS